MKRLIFATSIRRSIRGRITTRYTTTSAPATQAQSQAFTDTRTWDDHANLCYEEILTNKDGMQTQQSIALINGLEGGPWARETFGDKLT